MDRNQRSTSESRTDSNCTLCKRSSSQLSKPLSWRNKNAKVYAKSLGVSESHGVCRACRQDITLLLENETLVPRWQKERKKDCCVPGCDEISFCETSIVSADELSEILCTSVLIIPKPTPLCKSHYHAVYNKKKKHTQTNCSTCNTSLKGIVERSCPDPILIQQHLQEKTGFEGTLSVESKVCYTCYKSHLQVIRNLNVVSNDSSLADIIGQLKESLSNHDHSNIDNIKKYALVCTAIHVGEILLQQEAVLLPAVHEYFTEVASKCIRSTKIKFDGSAKEIVTARNILSHLIISLQQLWHLAIQERWKHTSHIILCITQATMCNW